MSSQNFINGAQLAGARGIFISPVTLSGNGAAQPIAHGLGRTPTRVDVYPVIGSNGAGAAGVQMPAAALAHAEDATNVTVTPPAAFQGGSWQIVAF